MLAGTALYVRLMVYMGLSLFIIRRALRIYGCMHINVYNLTWGALKNGKNGEEPNGFCLIVILKIGHVHFGIAPLSFNCFRRFFFLIPPCLFTVHIRPVLSPCQASNTCYTLTCFQTF